MKSLLKIAIAKNDQLLSYRIVTSLMPKVLLSRSLLQASEKVFTLIMIRWFI